MADAPISCMRLADFHDEGHGYDLFGMKPEAVARAAAIAAPIYDHYFRVDSHGADRVPSEGGALVAANHSGTVPVDASMLWLDVLRHTGRVLRPVADWFVPLLPFVSAMYSRIGVISGSRANIRYLLERGELVAVFPEGVAGVAKPFRDRYHLQEWHVGHAELAIRHRVPVIPVAIIGAEESWPVALRLKRFHAFGAPYVPIPASPLPLPVRYHIHYGEPLDIARDRSPEQADDPEVAAAAAAEVRDAVQQLIYRGLAARRGRS